MKKPLGRPCAPEGVTGNDDDDDDEDLIHCVSYKYAVVFFTHHKTEGFTLRGYDMNLIFKLILWNIL
jgi:hypothetical protein